MVVDSGYKVYWLTKVVSKNGLWRIAKRTEMPIPGRSLDVFDIHDR